MEIVVYHRAILLFRTDSEAVRRIHEGCSCLDDIGARFRCGPALLLVCRQVARDCSVVAYRRWGCYGGCVTARATIHVYLLEEATDTWRPVEAEVLGLGLFRIPAETAVPEGEQWEFQPGDVVRCEERTLLEGATPVRSLVAVERVPASN